MQYRSWVVPSLHLTNKIKELTHKPRPNHIQYISTRLIMMYRVDICNTCHGSYPTYTLPRKSKKDPTPQTQTHIIYLYSINYGVWSGCIQDWSQVVPNLHPSNKIKERNHKPSPNHIQYIYISILDQLWCMKWIHARQVMGRTQHAPYEQDQ